MSWIKRNLYFLLGSLVAVALLAVASLYCFQKSAADSRAMEAVNQAYEELNRLNSLNPHPGSGSVDNIAIAKQQQDQLRDQLRRIRPFYLPIRPLPDHTNVTAVEFTAQLRRTIDQLQRDAALAGVTLPPRYNFTFESIRPKVTFSSNSLQQLAVQLGDIKTLCDILFRAKINSLDNLRRERVALEDDPQSAAADYLPDTSVTNDLAVLTPYEITFRCFSSDLAGVIAGFAASPNGFIVKTLNIESATAAGAAPVETGGYPPPPPTTYAPPPQPMQRPGFSEEGVPARFAMPPSAPAVAPAPVASAPAGRSGPRAVINERVFKVSMRVVLVRLLPEK